MTTAASPYVTTGGRVQQAYLATGGLGFAPVLSLVIALGLLVSAFATVFSRNGTGAVAPPSADVAYWSGILLITFPAGVRLLSRTASTVERLALITMVGFGLYLVKILHDPVMFTYFDEFLHVRSVEDILLTGHLFVASPLLPVSPSFPGLETITAATVAMSGAPVYVSGVVLLGIARILLVIALFLFYLQISKSPLVAGIGAFIYMANPNFLFFQSQFAYESLAVPFAVFALYVVARREDGVDPRLRSWLVVGIAIAATVVTHHVTAFALFGLLLLWTAAALLLRRHSPVRAAPIMPTLLTGALLYFWLIAVAGIVVGYLGPALVAATTQLFHVLQGDPARTLFSLSVAPRPPLWEQAVAYLGIAVLLVATAWGAWVIWRRRRFTPPVAALAVATLAFPAILAARFTDAGAILSDRAAAYIFLAIGFVVATGLQWHGDTSSNAPSGTGLSAKLAPVRSWMARREMLWKPAVLAVIMISGVALAFPVWARLPGPYLVSADPRSIEPEGITAAEWANQYLPRDSRFVVDRVNRLLLGAIGEQHPVTASFDQIRVRTVFFSPTLGPTEVKVLADGAIRYVLVDRRLSSSLPIVGVYYEKGETSGGAHGDPMPAQALEKYDGVDDISRIFDSGDIQIYDVGALTQ